MSENTSRWDDREFPGNVLGLAEQFLSNRFLGGLSQEDRDELREHFEVVRRTFLDRRAPRIGLAGSEEEELEYFLGAIAGDAVPDQIDIKEELGRGRWYEYALRDVRMELLDLRRRDGEEPSLKALEHARPDLMVVNWEFRELSGDRGPGPATDEAIRDVERIVERCAAPGIDPPPVIALFDASRLPEDVTPRRAERVLRKTLREAQVRDSKTCIVRRGEVRRLDRELVEMAPMETRLRLARAVQTPESKKKLARMVIRSSAGLNAAIATIPLPFADFLPITGVQMSMIGAIGHLSGRSFSVETVGEFAAAIGVNVGAGYAVREIARAIVQFVPFAGSAVSSSIAAGATYALGNAAARYFIDEDLDEFDAAGTVPGPSNAHNTVDPHQ